MAEFTRIGFGQVEPNQLSAQKTGQIYASLKLDPEVNVLENGTFMYYDYVKNMVTATPSTAGQEPMLVFNEIKLYEDYLALKDFAIIRVGDNYVTNPQLIGRITSANSSADSFNRFDLDTGYGGGANTIGVNADPEHTEYGYRMDGIAPRLFKTNIGDVYTTNMVELGVEYEVGDILMPKLDSDKNVLVLSKTGDIEEVKYHVAKVYTMPDGQPGLKLQRFA